MNSWSEHVYWCVRVCKRARGFETNSIDTRPTMGTNGRCFRCSIRDEDEEEYSGSFVGWLSDGKQKRNEEYKERGTDGKGTGTNDRDLTRRDELMC